MEELKYSWKSKFSSDLPTEFITRLECELSKCENDPGAGDLKALSCVKDITKSRISELNKQLRNEEFFFEVISSVVSSRERKNKKEESGCADVSAMYAKVNKPVKLNIGDSGSNDQAPKMSDHVACNLDQGAGRLLSQSSCTYEEIGFPVSEIPASSPDIKVNEENKCQIKKKARASVKDKIKMFERSDSSSGDDNLNSPEGDYARLVIKPSVSPKPSPSTRRRPRDDEYEEISLPFLASNKKPDNPSSARNPSQQDSQIIDKPDKSHDDSKSKNDSSCKQEGYASLSEQPLENKSHTQHQKKSAPPVPSRKSRGIDANKHTDALKNTEALTLKYSDQEPQLSSSLRQKQINENIKGKSDTQHYIEIDDNIEGDYCSIRSVNTDNKHITLVNVSSNGSESGKRVNSGKNKNFSVLSIIRPEKELSKSTEDLRSNKTGQLRRSSSRSFDDLNQEGHYAEVQYSSVPDSHPKDDKMKKLFGLKEGSDLNTMQGDDTKEPIVGKQYKAISSNSSSEEDLMNTVVVDLEKTQVKDTSESTETLKAKDRRGRVPDYEKWTFQTLLTSTGISVAENGNLTDNGSDDDTPYDNVENATEKNEMVSGQSDDSGVCESAESSSTPDEKEKLYEEDCEHREKDSASSQIARSDVSKSSSSVGSRFSTACKYPILFFKIRSVVSQSRLALVSGP